MKYPQLVSSTTPASLQDWLEEELENRGIDGVYTRYILSLLQQDVSDFPECEHQSNKLQYKKSCTPMNTKEETVPYSGKSKHKRWKSWEREKLHKLRTCSCSSVFALDSEENRKSAVVECLKSASDGEIGIEMLVDELCFKLKSVKTDIVFDAEDQKIHNNNKNNNDKDEQDGDIDVSKTPTSPYEQAEKYYAAFPALSGKSEPLTKLCHQQERGYNMNTVWDGKKIIDPTVSKHNISTLSNSKTDLFGTSHSESTFFGTLNFKNETEDDLKESVAFSVIEKTGSWLKNIYEDENSSLIFPKVGLQGHQISTKARCPHFGMLWSHYFSLGSNVLLRSDSPLSYDQTKTVDDDIFNMSSGSNCMETDIDDLRETGIKQHGKNFMKTQKISADDNPVKAEGELNQMSQHETIPGALESKLCQSDELDEELLAKLCSKFDNLAAIWNKEGREMSHISQTDESNAPLGVSLHLLPLKEGLEKHSTSSVWSGQLPETEIVISRENLSKHHSEMGGYSQIFSTVYGYKVVCNEDEAEETPDAFVANSPTACLSDTDNLAFGEVLEVPRWREMDDLENSESDSSLSLLPETQRSSIDSTDSCLSSPVDNTNLKGNTVLGENYMLWDQRLPHLNHLPKMWSPNLSSTEMGFASECARAKDCSYDLGYQGVSSRWDVPNSCRKTNCTLTYHRGESRFVEVIPHMKKEENRNIIKSEFVFSGKPLSLDNGSPISECSSTDEENLLTSPKTHFQPIRQESVDTDTSEDPEVVSLTLGEVKSVASKQSTSDPSSHNALNGMNAYMPQDQSREKGTQSKKHSCEDKSPDSSPQWCSMADSEEKQGGSCARAVSSSLDELVSLIGPFSFDETDKQEYEQDSCKDLQFLFSTSWRLERYEDKGVNTDFPSSISDNESSKDAAISCWSTDPSEEDHVVEQNIQSLLFDKEEDKWLNISDSNNFISPGMHWKWGSVGDHARAKWSTGVADNFPSKCVLPASVSFTVDKFKEKNLKALRKEIKEEEDELFKDLSCLDRSYNDADDIELDDALKSRYHFRNVQGTVHEKEGIRNANMLDKPLFYAHRETYKWQDQCRSRNESFIPPLSRFCSVDSDDHSITTSVSTLPPEKVFYSHDLEEEWKMDSQMFHIQVPRRQSLKPKISSQKRPCSFYLEGNCRRSDCKFSHDLASITCRFWEEGSCFKGITCPFLHGYGSDSDESSPDSHSTECTFALESESDFPSLAKSATLDLSSKPTKTSIQTTLGNRSKKKKVAKVADCEPTVKPPCHKN